MALDFYRLSVGTFLRQLDHLDHILAKAQEHVSDERAEESVLLAGRLYPDQLNFTRQVQLATDFAKNSCAQLAGIEAPKIDHMEHSLSELRQRIAKTASFIKGIPQEAFAGAVSRDMQVLQRECKVAVSGEHFVLDYALPNFYFHYTTAYGILRHLGLTIHKSDYVGPM
jgi:hypothetical protein